MKRDKLLKAIGTFTVSFLCILKMHGQMVAEKKLSLDDMHFWKIIDAAAPAVNATGDYFLYEVKNEKPSGISVSHVRSVEGTWEKTYDKAGKMRFSRDGRKLYLLNEGRLVIQTLGATVKRSSGILRATKRLLLMILSGSCFLA